MKDISEIEKNIDILIKQKEGMVSYLTLKASQEDWHGVADAAMDIREIVAKIEVLQDLSKEKRE